MAAPTKQERDAVAPAIERAQIALVRLLGTRLAADDVREALVPAFVDVLRISDPDSPTPVVRPRAAVEAPAHSQRTTEPQSPRAKVRR